MALSKHYIPFKTEAEYWQIAQAIQHKVDGQKSLTYYERGFFCSGQKFEYLRHHKICDEEFYSRAHLELNTPENVKDDPRYREIMKFYGKKIAPLTDDDKTFYQRLIEEWKETVNNDRHSNQLLQFYCKETREEIRTLKKEFKKKRVAESTEGYITRERSIIEFSKYRYIITEGILKVIIRSDQYILSLNGIQIIYNGYSLSHIITRHYAAAMKQYETDKSHFIDVDYERLHLYLEDAFHQIDSSGLYIHDSIFEITYKLKDVLYRVYCNEVQESGKKIIRVNTFFPLEDREMIKTLNLSHKEEIIDRDFSIYLKK